MSASSSSSGGSIRPTLIDPLLRPDPRAVEGWQNMVDAWTRSWARSMRVMWGWAAPDADTGSGRPAPAAKKAEAPAPAPKAPAPFPKYGPGKTIADLAVGDAASITRTFTQEDVETFARLSGDDNPAHVDKEWAEASPFKGRVVHGVLTAGLISAVLGTKLPGPGAIYMSQSLRWTAPVYPGDELVATATVKEIIAEKGRVVMETIVSKGDQQVMVGEALIMPARAPKEPSAKAAVATTAAETSPKKAPAKPRAPRASAKTATAAKPAAAKPATAAKAAPKPRAARKPAAAKPAADAASTPTQPKEASS